jgi:geranylgeranyl pyrophosphate synthase/predicted secreted hydrolase
VIAEERVAALRPHYTPPSDWPSPGPIDLDVQDLPHASSTLEWWYVNAHVRTESGRELSLFASFFRTAIDASDFAYAVTWAIVDPANQRYLRESLVDHRAPGIVQQELERGLGTPDPMMRRALEEVVRSGRIPGPDKALAAPCIVGGRSLFLDYDGRRFQRIGNGEYRLKLHDADGANGADVTLRLVKPVVTHGSDGVVQGKSGERMFYYFSPRCAIEGSITVDGAREVIERGNAWYDHEFGRASMEDTESGSISWDWMSVQFENDWDLTIYCLVDDRTGKECGRYAVLIDPAGRTQRYDEFTFETARPWTSSKTFVRYPTAWRVHIPEADLCLEAEAAFAQQEFVTMISRPAFWEGRITARGSFGGVSVSGTGFVERSGFERNDNLPTFFGAVGKATRRSVQNILPLELDRTSAAPLAGGERHLDGVEFERLSRALVQPVRTIVDRGGKAWRSYVALACCDAVGGDSQSSLDWLALPELMHVGSLMVDDIQDDSVVRRGGPAAHLLYGEGLTINAATACYFLPHLFIRTASLDDSQKLRIYEQYFEATRAAHTGQALDIAGYADAMAEIAESGDGDRAAQHVRAVHRLKSAVPAGCLARIGGIIGGGTAAQIDALGTFVERVGLAFQMVDDVLNLSGFDGDYKTRGEDISAGKVTMPIAIAMSLLPRAFRRSLWSTLESRPTDRDTITETISLLEACGAIAECRRQASELVEEGWRALSPLLPDSQPKLMLRAFSWFVLERHY